MRGFGGLWKVLGASTSKNQKKAIAVVGTSEEFDAWAGGLSDAEIADEAHALNLLEPTPEASGKYLALAREAADRAIGLRPFDVQLQGALRMLAGDVVEMATGEGKTLSGAIAAAGYALQGYGTHVISVNDYLARRDAEWMGPFFSLLGLSVGWVEESSTRAQRKAAYAADVTYGSVTEIGFDILRDQLVTDPSELISPQTDVAVVDEADSVLVDEALVPLVLAGSTTGDAPGEEIIAAVKKLREGRHYATDIEQRNIYLTDDGAEVVEEALGGINLYDEEHVGTTLVQVNVALHAQVLLRRDVHYIVREGKVQLINASRGRVAELQRWPDGLQAAVEAKEGVPISETGEILDSITVQALIGRYKTVCGMTGTALAAGEQFRKFYGLGVSQIAPNTPNIREDEPDRVYDTAQHKLDAIVDYIAEVNETGQPLLIGTHDVAESEELAGILRERGIECAVLNAKNDEEEAAIIAEAGALGRVTVSTQMAGRGTDIRLGGSAEGGREEVVAAGGLCVVGTGRHRTERLDNQLRGRSGRQGDPGRSVFFSSLEDEVVLTGAPDETVPNKVEGATGLMLTARARQVVDHAQRVTDGQMLEVHSTTWRYSQLMADQRDIIERRREALLTTDRAAVELKERAPQRWEALSEELSPEQLERAAREIMLYHLDRGWSKHLGYLADVRESIHLRALGRENPLDEFHRLAIDAFRELAEEAVDASVVTFTETEISQDGTGLELGRLARPTSTWTYMVHDNPLASGGDNATGLTGIFR